MTIRYLGGHEESVEVLAADAQGLTVRAGGLKVYLNWYELDDACARSLQQTFLSPEQQKSPGPRVHGKRVKRRDGSVVEGMRLDWSNEREVLLKTIKGTMTIAVSDIVEYDDVELALRDVLTPEELYRQIQERLQPDDPDGWEKFSRELTAVGLPDRAQAAARVADLLRRVESPEHSLHRGLGDLRAALIDIGLRQSVYDVQEEYLLGHYEKAIQLLKVVRSKVTPDTRAAEELERVHAELVTLRTLSLEARIAAEWSRNADGILLEVASSRSTSIDDAERAARERADKDAEARTAASFGFTPGDRTVRDAWERRPADRLLVHSYAEASWLVSRAEARGGGESWWTDAPKEQKFAYLKGLYIESARKVVRVDAKNCPACGARRQVGGKTCTGCGGLGTHRVLIYR